MKLSSGLETQLSKILFASIGYGALVALLLLYGHAFELRNRAGRYFSEKITSQLEAEAPALTRQALSIALDNWIDSQGMMTGIEVLTSGGSTIRLGEPENWGPFVLKMRKNLSLKSGQTINILISLDYRRPIYLVLMVVILYLGLVFYDHAKTGKRIRKIITRVTEPLETRVRLLGSLAKDLPNSIRGKSLSGNSPFEELSALDEAFVNFAKQILIFEEQLEIESFAKGRVKMAELLAHDIKSSVGLLQLRIQNLNSLSIAEKKFLQDTVNAVFSTAKNLLVMRQEANGCKISGGDPGRFDLLEVLQEVVLQKQESLEKIKNIQIEMCTGGGKFHVRGDPFEFAMALGNLIDNSTEAVGRGGLVRADFEIKNGEGHLTISDNGHGFDTDLLPKIFDQGVSTKMGGNGLGLLRTKLVVEKIKGKLEMSSLESGGTRVSIRIPRLEGELVEPFAHAEFQIAKGQELILVTAQKMETLFDLPSSELPKLKSFASQGDLESWLNEKGLGKVGSRIYCFHCSDLSYLDKIQDFIQKWDLKFESYILGDADFSEVRSKSLVELSSFRIISVNELVKSLGEMGTRQIATEIAHPGQIN